MAAVVGRAEPVTDLIVEVGVAWHLADCFACLAVDF